MFKEGLQLEKIILTVQLIHSTNRQIYFPVVII